MTPFLLRFARECVGPAKAHHSTEYYYDENISLTRSALLEGNPPAVLVEGASGPSTKKADVEKGEDMKDNRMW